MHPRRQIIEAVKQSLSEISFLNVFVNQKPNLSPTDLPAVTILPSNESSEMLAQSVRSRNLSIVLEVREKGDDLTERLDSFAKEIELVFLNDETLGGLVKHIFYGSTDWQYSDESSEALMSMEFNVLYTTA